MTVFVCTDPCLESRDMGYALTGRKGKRHEKAQRNKDPMNEVACCGEAKLRTWFNRDAQPGWGLPGLAANTGYRHSDNPTPTCLAVDMFPLP
jgi:hypothetical protein